MNITRVFCNFLEIYLAVRYSKLLVLVHVVQLLTSCMRWRFDNFISNSPSLTDSQLPNRNYSIMAMGMAPFRPMATKFSNTVDLPVVVQ